MKCNITKWIIVYIIIFLIVGYWQSMHVAYEWIADVSLFGMFKTIYFSQEFFISNTVVSLFVIIIIYGVNRLKKGQ